MALVAGLAFCLVLLRSTAQRRVLDLHARLKDAGSRTIYGDHLRNVLLQLGELGNPLAVPLRAGDKIINAWLEASREALARGMKSDAALAIVAPGDQPFVTYCAGEQNFRRICERTVPGELSPLLARAYRSQWVGQFSLEFEDRLLVAVSEGEFSPAEVQFLRALAAAFTL